MVETRKAADNPCESTCSPYVQPLSVANVEAPPRGVASPLRSPAVSRPSSLPAPPALVQPPLKRGPRPSSLAVDKSAPPEDQLAALKNVFARANMGASQGGGEPLSEIDDPQNR